MELIVRRDSGFRQAYSVTSEDKNLHIIGINAEEELFLEGSFFYQTRNGKFEKFNLETLDDQLKKSFLENTVQTFIETVEGVYAGIYIDKKNEKIIVFSDKLKREEIYYCVDANEVIVSTSLRNLRGKSKGYSPQAIISILYLYAPKGSTIHNNIFRLRYNEIIEIAGGKLKIVKHNEAPLEIRDYDGRDLERFKEVIENAIISRASDEINIVSLSGGWDSTFLLSVLQKYYESSKIKALTMETIYSGSTVNIFEVEKAKKIAKFFGIDHDIIKVDHADVHWIDLWEQKVKGTVINHGVYDPFLLSQALATSHLHEKYGEAVVTFNGEACDSMTNFGFSQYHSIAHDNRGFCEYADKMASYLYSPSFLTRVLNNDYKDELIFRIFRWDLKDSAFTGADSLPREDRIFEYVLPFVYAPNRIPFVQLEKTNFVKEAGIRQFKDWLKSEYFGETIANIDPQNCYYWLLRLYVDFHWQGANIRKVREGWPNARIPFLDYAVFGFFAQMPENWGRGLEINSTKYPLKQLIRKNHYKFPISVVDSPGPHSYTITFADLKHEYIYNSSLSQYLLGNTDFEKKYREFFSSDCFDLDCIRKYVADIKGGKIDRISSTGFNLLNFLMQVE